jgi:hypothetical protein
VHPGKFRLRRFIASGFDCKRDCRTALHSSLIFAAREDHEGAIEGISA